MQRYRRRFQPDETSQMNPVRRAMIVTAREHATAIIGK
jgi:hypothetical protein